MSYKIRPDWYGTRYRTAGISSMASNKPATDRPRPAQKSRFWPRVFSALSVSAVVLAPVAAMALWLLISDPVTAAAVMERGDLMPVLAALVKILGKALVSVFSAL